MNSGGLTREQCFSALAHELRNPLASIMSSVELMQTLGQHAKEIPHLLEVVDRKVVAMSTVIDEFLETSTVARVTLAAKQCSSSDKVTAPIHTTELSTSKLRVLIVDDNTTAADNLSQLLTLRGFDVQTAYGGQEGFQKALAFLPEAAILDIEMPDVDGYKLANMLQAKQFSCTCIALTGYGQEHDKLRTVKAGFSFHLTKPTRLEDIQAILRTVSAKLEKKRI